MYITHEDIARVEAHNHLESLFKGKQRIVFPFRGGYKNLQAKLKKQKKYEFDLQKGICKSHRGQYIKITRALNELNPEYLKKYQGVLCALVSRHPIDLLRMSDFPNIQSCHSKGSSKFSSAVREANDGGAIVYLVKKEEVDRVNLNDEEVLYNSCTGRGLIKPIARIRLRRIVFNGKTRLGYSTRYGCYTNNFDRFVEKTFASKQRAILYKSELEGGKYEPFYLKTKNKLNKSLSRYIRVSLHKTQYKQWIAVDMEDYRIDPMYIMHMMMLRGTYEKCRQLCDLNMVIKDTTEFTLKEHELQKRPIGRGLIHKIYARVLDKLGIKK